MVSKRCYTMETSRHLGVLLPALEISEILDFVCQELASLTRARDYSLLWANSKQPADLTVNDAEEVCQYFIRRNVSGVFSGGSRYCRRGPFQRDNV